MNNNFDSLKKNIIDKDLCTSCGTCIGLCPAKCIDFCGEKIVKNSNACIACGNCIKNCPGADFDYKSFCNELYESSYDNHRLGCYKGIYSGFSQEKNIRNNAASGGVITEILTFLLEKHLIDGAITVKASENNPSEFEPSIAYTKEEIIEGMQSKYQLIPTNAILEQIIKKEGKYAIVGLPCQIQGVRKAIKNNNILKKRIFICIGLFCGFNMYSSGTDYLIKKSGIKKRDVKELNYRKKINGETGFYVSDGIKNKFIPKHEYTYLNLFYSPKRCLMCYDYSAEFADISIGDAWEKGLGCSRIITRTNLGQNIISELVSQKKLILEESSENDIKNTQKKILAHKKRDIWYRWKKYRYIPNYNIGEQPDNIKISNKGKLQYYIMKFGNNKFGRIILSIIPFALLRKVSRKLRK